VENCRKFVERFYGPSSGRRWGKIAEELGNNCRNILRALRQKTFLQFFHNSSTILPRVEEFGASGLAWRRIVKGIIVEKLWKHLVNSAPDGSVTAGDVHENIELCRKTGLDAESFKKQGRESSKLGTA
jgi:hypothetical protein